MTDNAVVIAALQCDYYHYAICYIGSVAVVVPLWLRHRFCVAVLSCKRGNSSVIYTCYPILKYLGDTTTPYNDGLHMCYINAEVNDNSNIAQLMQ